MKDYEILLWLMNLKPESEEQRKAIEAAEKAFRNSKKLAQVDKSVEDFLQMYSKEELVNVASGELYNEYFNFCDQFNYIPVSQNMLSRTVNRLFNLKCRPVLIKNKTVRVFK